MSRTEAVRAIESEKQYAERAEVAKQQAILEERIERTKQSDKIQELYSEINELRKELHSVQTSKRKSDR